METLTFTTRSTHYREQAVRLRETAGELPIGDLRERLLRVAGEYEELADTIEHRSAV